MPQSVSASFDRSQATFRMLANPSRIAWTVSGQPIQVAPLRLFIIPSTIQVTHEASSDPRAGSRDSVRAHGAANAEATRTRRRPRLGSSSGGRGRSQIVGD